MLIIMFFLHSVGISPEYTGQGNNKLLNSSENFGIQI